MKLRWDYSRKRRDAPGAGEISIKTDLWTTIKRNRHPGTRVWNDNNVCGERTTTTTV